MSSTFDKTYAFGKELSINESAQFVHSKTVPFYKDNTLLYTGMFRNFMTPYDVTGWRDEQLSWIKSCYIHGNLAPTPVYVFSGPQAKEFLSKYCVNTFEKFPVGTMKHCICCSERGYLTGDGVVFRTGEEEYEVHWVVALSIAYMQDGQYYDVTFEDRTDRRFLFQLAGPRSLEVLEKVLEEDVHDLKYGRIRNAKIKGKDVRILRFGMAGGLSYEIHGNAEDAVEIYDLIYETGKEFGIRRLGFHTYLMQHTINGFPQFGQHYCLDGGMSSDFDKAGSMSDQPLENYLVTPYDIGQGFVVKFDHDFVGREALEKIAPNPPRKVVTLEWNSEDIVDVFASQFTEEPYEPMDDAAQFNAFASGTHYDKILKDNKQVGKSANRIYALYYHKMISMGFVDAEYAKEGTELTLIWGAPGSRQKEIRVTVARFPYLDITTNKATDVEEIPRYQK